jgi:hypothetical protein
MAAAQAAVGALEGMEVVGVVARVLPVEKSNTA